MCNNITFNIALPSKTGFWNKKYLELSERVFSTIIKVLNGISISIYLYIILGLITVYNRVQISQ